MASPGGPRFDFAAAFADLEKCVSQTGAAFADLDVDVLKMAQVFNAAYNANLNTTQIVEAMARAADKATVASLAKAAADEKAADKQSSLDSFYTAFEDLRETVSKSGKPFADLNVDTVKMAEVFKKAVNAGLSVPDAFEAMRRAAQEEADQPAKSSAFSGGADLKAAFDLLSGTIQHFVSSVKGYAAALSPTTAQWFDTSLRNLNATLGQAVLPIFSLLATTIERFSGVISPMAQALAPVFANLTAAFSTAGLAIARTFAGLAEGLAPIIGVLASSFTMALQTVTPWLQFVASSFSQLAAVIGILQGVFSLLMSPVMLVMQLFGELASVAMMPVTFAFQTLSLVLLPVQMLFEALSEVMTSFHDITRVIQIVFDSLYQTIKDVVVALMAQASAFLGFRSIIDAVKKAFADVAVAVALFTVKLAMAFGQLAFVDKMIEGLKREGKETGALAAPTNSAIKDFEQIAKDMAVAAFVSGPGGPAVSDSDVMKRILEEVVEARKGEGYKPQIAELIGKVENVADKLTDLIQLLRNPTFTPEPAKAAAKGALEAGWRALGL